VSQFSAFLDVTAVVDLNQLRPMFCVFTNVFGGLWLLISVLSRSRIREVLDECLARGLRTIVHL
jgi:hypothetical protein